LGSNVPVIGQVSVYRKSKQRHFGIEIDVEITWIAETSIKLVVPHVCSFGISRFQMTGEISVVLRPLIDSLPIVGGLQVFMISPPDLEWSLTGAASLTELPIIAGVLRSSLMEKICNTMVLPNRLFIHWLWRHQLDLTDALPHA